MNTGSNTRMMKWESADLTVGAVIVAAVLIITATLLWLSPALADRTYPLYTEFQRIDGIAERGAVRLYGYEVGRIDAIEPRTTADGSIVFRVRLGIRSRLASGDSLFLPQGTRAVLAPPPAPIVPGAIVLRPPPNGGPPLRPGATIPGEREVAMLDEVRSMSDRLAEEIVRTTTSARTLLDSLSRTAGAANRALAITTAELPRLLDGLRAELAAADSLTNEVRGHLDRVTPATLASIDSAQLLLADSRRLVTGIDGMLTAREPEIATIMANLDTTTVLLTHFVRQVSDRPWRLITGVDPPPGLDHAGGLLSAWTPDAEPTVTVDSVGDARP